MKNINYNVVLEDKQGNTITSKPLPHLGIAFEALLMMHDLFHEEAKVTLFSLDTSAENPEFKQVAQL